MKQSGHPRKPGKRGKTRSKFRKHDPKVSVNDIMQAFSKGDKVQIVIDSSYHYGIPHKSFQGLTGVVSGTRGEAYIIDVLKGNQALQVVTTPVHMKKLK